MAEQAGPPSNLAPSQGARIGNFLSQQGGAIGAGLGSVFGAVGDKQATDRTQGMADEAFAPNPQGFQGGFGAMSFGPNGGQFTQSDALAGNTQGIHNQINFGLSGQGGPLTSAASQFTQGQPFQQAMGQQQDFLGQGFNFDQSGLNNLQGQVGGLMQGAGQQFLAGPQDASGQVSGLFGRANNLLDQDNFDQRQGQVLDNLRAQAAPQEQRSINQLGSALFGTGRRATQGGLDVAGQFQGQLNQADLARQGSARGFALQEREADRGLAQGLMGQGFAGVQQGLNQNIAQGQLAQGFGGLQGSLQNQEFGQQLQGQQQNVSQGQMRIANMMQQFGIGQDARAAEFAAVPGLAGVNQGQQGLENSLNINSQNADANRMSSQADVMQAEAAQTQANAAAAASSGGGFAEMAGGFAGAALTSFSDARLKMNLQPYKTIDNIDFFTWDWNAEAELLNPIHKGRDFGVVAQQLQTVHPELVHEDEASGYLKVDYNGLWEKMNAS